MSNLTTDDLADRAVHECLSEYCQEVVSRDIKSRMVRLVKEEIAGGADEKKKKHDQFFGALFKAISPYQAEFKAMLKAVWDEEERIIVANLKKLKKAWMTKDIIDQLLYPIGLFEKKLADGTTKIFLALMEREGRRIAGLYDLDVVFDVANPAVQHWLETYTPEFSTKLEAVNIERLRTELSEGMRAGEGIRELTNRIYETYTDWGFRRAELIARTETLRASNMAALETYRQSGVVEKKIWITHWDDRTCEYCMDLDGNIIDLEDDFEGGIDGPPLHPRCRCAVGPFVED